MTSQHPCDCKVPLVPDAGLGIGAELPAARRLWIDEIGMPRRDFVECPDIDDAAAIHKVNAIAELNRAEAMRDDNDGLGRAEG